MPEEGQKVNGEEGETTKPESLSDNRAGEGPAHDEPNAKPNGREKKGQNPRESSLPGGLDLISEDEITEDATSHEEDPGQNESKRSRRARRGWKNRKRGRQVRVASVKEVETPQAETWHIHELPNNQYETVLRRRAIKKGNPQSKSISERPKPLPSPKEISESRRTIFGSAVDRSAMDFEEDFSRYEEDVVGDVSLGMKLNIIGGKVIVQHVTPLADGRASPAQLSGVIQRGDVLLCIEDRSIVNIPIDQLVGGLKPLSSPQENGDFTRTLRLRFAIGEGLTLLNKSEAQAARGNSDGTDMFSLPNFIPQTSPGPTNSGGSPVPQATAVLPSGQQGRKIIVSNAVVAKVERSAKPADADEQKQVTTLNTVVHATAIATVTVPEKGKELEPDMTPGKAISLAIAEQRQKESERYISEFFAWDKKRSKLLRPSIIMTVQPDEHEDAFLTKKQMVEKGIRAMKGARVLALGVENIDKGKDLRFLSWNSNISLRSHTSARRKLVFDAASMASSKASATAAASVSSEAVEEFEGVEGDDLLVHLASQDEIWRMQVIATLTKTGKEVENDEKGITTEPDTNGPSDLVPKTNSDDANDLGSLFLGQEVHQMLTKKKKSYALPPAEVTSVLFDLVSHLGSATPDEISLKGGFGLNSEMVFIPLYHPKRSAGEEDRVLAAQFVLQNAFPLWLKSFRPLKWEQRRALWIGGPGSSNDTIASGSLAPSDDGMSIHSNVTGNHSQRRKNLQETIEEMELGSETRVETCFLLTFYFTREILPKLRNREKRDQYEVEAIEFVQRYGSYLRLPISVAFTGVVHSEKVLSELLSLAKHDKHHRELMKELNKNKLILYDANMLSAICARLQGIRQERSKDSKERTVSLSALAYPDVRPWQVRQACGADSNEFYEYLTRLLDPLEGHDRARRDDYLVKEWCSLSMKPVNVGWGRMAVDKARMKNFLMVASRKSNDHVLYCRDLAFLMDTSIAQKQNDLFLDLVDEILRNPALSSKKDTIEKALVHIRGIAKQSLESTGGSFDEKSMQMIISLLEKMDRTTNGAVSVAKEMGFIFSSSRPEGLNTDHPGALELRIVNILARSSSPNYSLDALFAWTLDRPVATDVLPALQKILKDGSKLRVHDEVSSTLLQISKSRADMSTHAAHAAAAAEMVSESSTKASSANTSSGDIWRRMLQGSLPVNK